MVPPELIPSAEASVSTPAEENDEVALAPKSAVFAVTACEKKFVLVPFVPVKRESAVVPLKVVVFEKVFAVYVFGIVVDEWMNVCTRVSR